MGGDGVREAQVSHAGEVQVCVLVLTRRMNDEDWELRTIKQGDLRPGDSLVEEHAYLFFWPVGVPEDNA